MASRDDDVPEREFPEVLGVPPEETKGTTPSSSKHRQTTGKLHYVHLSGLN